MQETHDMDMLAGFSWKAQQLLQIGEERNKIVLTDFSAMIPEAGGGEWSRGSLVEQIHLKMQWMKIIMILP